MILLGKYLESQSKKQTVDKLSKLASLKVTKAYLVKPSTTSLSEIAVETDIDLLQIGDLVKVQNGQTIPFDGTIVLGVGLCNESMLTGESEPVPKKVNSKVYGGTMVTVGSFIVRV